MNKKHKGSVNENSLAHIIVQTNILNFVLDIIFQAELIVFPFIIDLLELLILVVDYNNTCCCGERPSVYFLLLPMESIRKICKICKHSKKLITFY